MMALDRSPEADAVECSKDFSRIWPKSLVT
jgi:hypothetical protein